ncbi:MAG: hypothetical protein LBS00_11465 [Synergistaceae bacterium]|nr:hypothetical protein [Synergistaceae bacterium]
MHYTLMHKNLEAAEIVIDEATAAIQKVERIKNLHHLPIGTTVNARENFRKLRRDLLNELVE